MPKALLSYSWDSEAHRAWVRGLAERLRGDGVEVTLDQWHIVPGDQLPQFMENAVRESDFVLIVCTPRYKQRSDGRVGGVGYEGDIITGEVLINRNQRKFITLLRAGSWQEAAPVWLAGKYYVDLSREPYSEQQYQDLLTTLLGSRLDAPPVRSRASPGPTRSMVAPPTSAAPSEISAVSFEPIKISGIVADHVGVPRNDGTRGSALYRVPFRLTRRPPIEWAQIFVEAWNHPRKFTSMHRPGIASVDGDVVTLDGTTLEEVERYHRDTLLLAASDANEKYAAYMEKRRAAEERERQRAEEHRRSVEDMSRRIKFE